MTRSAPPYSAVLAPRKAQTGPTGVGPAAVLDALVAEGGGCIDLVVIRTDKIADFLAGLPLHIAGMWACAIDDFLRARQGRHVCLVCGRSLGEDVPTAMVFALADREYPLKGIGGGVGIICADERSDAELAQIAARGLSPGARVIEAAAIAEAVAA